MYLYIYIYINTNLCIIMYYLDTKQYIIMYYLNTKCPLGHYHNGFMATGTPSRTRIRLPAAGVQETKERSSC